MSDPLGKVVAGQPLEIHADTFNSFVDAAADYRRRSLSLGQTSMASAEQATIVTVKNDSGADQDRSTVLGIDKPIILPADNQDAFENHVALSCLLPVKNTHEGKFVVLAEPIATGKIGRAYAAGVCPVQIDVPDISLVYPTAEIIDNLSTNLRASFNGSASILWRAGGVGAQWALIRFGIHRPIQLFPVVLAMSGGVQGTETSPATWLYNVTDLISGSVLLTNAAPVTAPHKWQRPSVGWMIPATFGYAHYERITASNSYQLVLGWINEMVDQAACV